MDVQKESASMSELSPERRKVVLLCSSAAAMSGCSVLLLKRHPVLWGIWMAVVLGVLVYAIAKLAKLNRRKWQGR